MSDEGTRHCKMKILGNYNYKEWNDEENAPYLEVNNMQVSGIHLMFLGKHAATTFTCT